MKNMIKIELVNKYSFDKENFDGIIVYIGRGSPFGNPYIMKKNTEKERYNVINKFKELFYYEKAEIMLQNKLDLILKEAIRIKKNIALVCFCVPKKCHGEIILEYMENKLKNM